MSIIHRTVFGSGGTVSPLSATPSVSAAPSSGGFTFVEIPLTTGPFGPLPTRFGISTDVAGFIMVDTSALQGIIDCGDYP